MSSPHRREAPPANKGLLALAGVLLAIPIIALMLVGTYAKEEPRLGDWPFFIWYQFLWVIICSAATYTAYRIVLKARPHVPMTQDGTEFLDSDASDPRGGAGAPGAPGVPGASDPDSTGPQGGTR
ncbi:uncharacterized protein DUF3311 [Terracoccus luteus]|uniref:Uncharacterized protein DUF3311 n=1 Tax=Terracoccus luteus TaxID=53356 RepID=A0A495XUI0_9MICO|nr:DUF3311 domain-containing protein [Terracoccus luteus]RKT77602.1 uncharacterized protein DUF3311 [Terracoccus luteus]